jgi:hypothetical protein
MTAAPIEPAVRSQVADLASASLADLAAPYGVGRARGEAVERIAGRNTQARLPVAEFNSSI